MSQVALFQSLLSQVPPHHRLAFKDYVSKHVLDLEDDSAAVTEHSALVRRPSASVLRKQSSTATEVIEADRRDRTEKQLEDGDYWAWMTRESAEHVLCLLKPAKQLSPFPELLHAVQTLNIYTDCKEFVDMSCNKDAADVAAAWSTVSIDDRNDPSVVKAFINEHFMPPGSDQETFADFPDWSENPALLGTIEDTYFREWARALNGLWKVFGRRTSPAVQDHPDRFSMIPLPNPYVVPGGRFRECYYWDSFWVVLGLLQCDMVDTATGIVLNIMSTIEQHGFMPNGARKYYLNRSQPPLACEMLMKIHEARPNPDLLRRCLPTLLKEYNFFMDQDSPNAHCVAVDVDGSLYRLNRYAAWSQEPRPESYREDLEVAERVAAASVKTAKQVYSHIAAAAETGWDFSTRWFRDASSMDTINTMEVLPVDLNAILYVPPSLISLDSDTSLNATSLTCMSKSGSIALAHLLPSTLLSALSLTWRHSDPLIEHCFRVSWEGAAPSVGALEEMCRGLGDVNEMSLTEHGFLVVFAAPLGAAALTEHTVEAHTVHLVPQGHMYWLVAAERRRVVMERVMYDQDTSQWYDYNYVTETKSTVVAASNFTPLWAGCCTKQQATRAVEVLRLSPLVSKGGVACTDIFSQQQWDFPCAWPPVQWFVVEGLRLVGSDTATRLARRTATTWLWSNFHGFEREGKMFEKYDVRALGWSGWGGE